MTGAVVQSVEPSHPERPMPAPSDFSGPLAERYCDMLDVLGEIDLAAVERRIERLTRLRDALVRMRDGAPVSPPPPDTVERKRRIGGRPRTYWCDVFQRAMDAGPKTVAELHALTGGELTAGSVYNYLNGTPTRFERVPDTAPLRWRAAAPQREPA